MLFKQKFFSGLLCLCLAVSFPFPVYSATNIGTDPNTSQPQPVIAYDGTQTSATTTSPANQQVPDPNGTLGLTDSQALSQPTPEDQAPVFDFASAKDALQKIVSNEIPAINDKIKTMGASYQTMIQSMTAVLSSGSPFLKILQGESEGLQAASANIQAKLKTSNPADLLTQFNSLTGSVLTPEQQQGLSDAYQGVLSVMNDARSQMDYQKSEWEYMGVLTEKFQTLLDQGKQVMQLVNAAKADFENKFAADKASFDALRQSTANLFIASTMDYLNKNLVDMKLRLSQSQAAAQAILDQLPTVRVPQDAERWLMPQLNQYKDIFGAGGEFALAVQHYADEQTYYQALNQQFAGLWASAKTAMGNMGTARQIFLQAMNVLTVNWNSLKPSVSTYISDTADKILKLMAPVVSQQVPDLMLKAQNILKAMQSSRTPQEAQNALSQLTILGQEFTSGVLGQSLSYFRSEYTFYSARNAELVPWIKKGMDSINTINSRYQSMKIKWDAAMSDLLGLVQKNPDFSEELTALLTEMKNGELAMKQDLTTAQNWLIQAKSAKTLNEVQADVTALQNMAAAFSANGFYGKQLQAFQQSIQNERSVIKTLQAIQKTYAELTAKLSGLEAKIEKLQQVYTSGSLTPAVLNSLKSSVDAMAALSAEITGLMNDMKLLYGKASAGRDPVLLQSYLQQMKQANTKAQTFQTRFLNLRQNILQKLLTSRLRAQDWRALYDSLR